MAKDARSLWFHSLLEWGILGGSGVNTDRENGFLFHIFVAMAPLLVAVRLSSMRLEWKHEQNENNKSSFLKW